MFSASEKTSDPVRISWECPNFPGQPGTVRKAPFSLCKLIVNLLSFKHSEKRNYPSSQVENLYSTLSELISGRCVAKSTEWKKSKFLLWFMQSLPVRLISDLHHKLFTIMANGKRQ